MSEEILQQLDDQTIHIKGIVEALLFVNEKPLTTEQIRNALAEVSVSEIKKVIQILQEECAQRQSGMKIVEIAGGYQMLSNPSYASYIRDFYKTKHKEKLSKPALETLAIIAYKQPVTRGDVELIRGVNSDGVMAHLFGKELIKAVGRKDVPGRPFLYGTTKQFLEYFGLKSLEDLPKLEEFPALLAPREGNEHPSPGNEAVPLPPSQVSGEVIPPPRISVQEPAVGDESVSKNEIEPEVLNDADLSTG